MSEQLRAVRSYGSRLEAEIARDVLAMHDIPAYVSADDGGGMRPTMAFTLGVRLIVRERDLRAAFQILEDDDAILLA